MDFDVRAVMQPLIALCELPIFAMWVEMSPLLALL